MSTRGTELTQKVIDALQTIDGEGAFSTDAGQRVIHGRAEHMRLDKYELPLLVVSTTGSINSAPKPRTVRKDREIVITGVVDASAEDYEKQIDELDEDIVRALLPLTHIDAMPDALQVQFTGGEYTHPEDGSNQAAISFSFNVSYALTFHNHEG